MKPITVTFIVTKACQLHCKYCYLVGKNYNEVMSYETATKVIDYIVNSKDNIFNGNAIVLDFIGGEPLLEIDLISDICEYFITKVSECKHRWSKNYRFRITTNGLLYSNPKVQNFISKYHKNIDISISIDGTQEKNDINRVFSDGSGSYQKIINSVRLWKEQFEKIGTKMVISHEDVNYVFESAKHLIELGITNLDMNTVVENVWQDGDDIIFENQLIKLADYVIDTDLYNGVNLYIFEECIGHPFDSNNILTPCGEKELSVDASGNFYTCLRFAKFSLRSKNERTIGNIKSGINKNKLRPFLTANDYTISLSKCRWCEIATGCRWCPAENYDSSESGTIFQRSLSVCKMHHARVRAKNYYWNKLKSITM
jgi:uncharacterized protein